MILPDGNVLVHAFRSDSSNHETCATWIDGVVNGDARGNLMPDVWFAALAIESGCEWITFDRDFARFPGLRWRVPA